jgi:hypothetical protein
VPLGRLIFAAARFGVYRFVMRTLSELETVVDCLPLAEQEELLRHLEAKLRHQRNSAASPAAREEWMRRLDVLRAQISAGNPRLTSEQIISELRGE